MTTDVEPSFDGRWTVIYLTGKSTSGKTSIWTVRAKADGVLLGNIQWFGRWRQYVFAPAAGTVWNATCLTEVSTFLATEMSARQRDSEKDSIARARAARR